MEKSKGRGGRRPGAGRKPGSRNTLRQDSTVDLFPGAAGAIVKALASAQQYQFIAAMQALEAPLSETRAALQQSEQQFADEWAGFLLDISPYYDHNVEEVKALHRRSQQK
ncbi:hypothetical protein [Bradyrhizobium sp. USDA 3315]